MNKTNIEIGLLIALLALLVFAGGVSIKTEKDAREVLEAQQLNLTN